MVLLDPKLHFKALEPLSKLSINTLFVRAVIENFVEGKIFVNDAENPTSFIAYHPYGMSLLFGETENEIFNRELPDYMLNKSKVRSKYEWMQAFPAQWNEKIEIILKHYLMPFSINLGKETKQRIEVNTRVNFKFNPEIYADYKSSSTEHDFPVVRTDEEMFESTQGSVIPKYFWKTADQFCSTGVGFSLIFNEQAVSTAYSAFIIDDKLELGIETSEKYRGNGFAEMVCSRLIDYCLDNGFEPIWSCRLENAGSFKLARKLGFEPTVYLPFYRLPV